MLAHSVLFKFYHLTGGDSGMRVPRMRILGLEFTAYNKIELLAGPFYYYCLALLVVLGLVMWRIVHSPFGLHLAAIRENPRKAEYLGVHVYRCRLAAFVISVAYGAVGGAILGVWLGVSPFASRLLSPYLNALNALPKVALAPLFVLWFGLGLESKIALAAVLVLFLVFLNTFAGVREVDQDLIDGARLMRATRAQVIAKVIIPSAMSWVFAGLKISVPYALIGAVLGEMIAANRGLGYLVQFSGAQFDSAGVFAVLLVIALLAVGLNFLVEIVQHRMERWRIVGR